MSEWRTSTRVAAALLDSAGRPRRGILPGAAVRAAVILDAAHARFIAPEQRAIHVSITAAGFAPADELLTHLAEPAGDLSTAIRSGTVGLNTMADEFVKRGWWFRLPRSMLRTSPRYRPSELLARDVHDVGAEHLTELIRSLFVAGTDTDDLRESAATCDFGAGTLGRADGL